MYKLQCINYRTFDIPCNELKYSILARFANTLPNLIVEKEGEVGILGKKYYLFFFIIFILDSLVPSQISRFYAGKLS